jgi:hypothetical protein
LRASYLALKISLAAAWYSCGRRCTSPKTVTRAHGLTLLHFFSST